MKVGPYGPYIYWIFIFREKSLELTIQLLYLHNKRLCLKYFFIINDLTILFLIFFVQKKNFNCYRQNVCTPPQACDNSQLYLLFLCSERNIVFYLFLQVRHPKHGVTHEYNAEYILKVTFQHLGLSSYIHISHALGLHADRCFADS